MVIDETCGADSGPHEQRVMCEGVMRLQDELLDLLAVMFDAYEEGPNCYEDPEEQAGFVGKAIKLDEATFDRIADLLNEHRPRVTEIHNVEVSGAAK